MQRLSGLPQPLLQRMLAHLLTWRREHTETYARSSPTSGPSAPQKPSLLMQRLIICLAAACAACIGAPSPNFPLAAQALQRANPVPRHRHPAG